MIATNTAGWRDLQPVVTAMCVVAAGYPSYLYHPMTLVAPVPLLLVLLFLDNARLVSPAWIIGVSVMTIWTVLLYLAMAGTARGLVHSLAMSMPFAALAFRVRRSELVALAFSVLTTLLVSARVIVSWVRAGAQWQPWKVYEGNDLAPRLTLMLPLVILAFLSVPAERRWLRGALIVLVLAGLTAIAMSLQRAALAVLVVLVVISLARSYRKGLLVFGVAVLAGGLLASESAIAVLERARFVNFVNSHATRPEIWRVALDAIRESAWLGVGPGNSGDALREVGGGHAHNGLVQSALEGGWPGALMFAGVALYLVVLAARLVRQGGRATLWALPLLGYLGFSVLSAPLQRPDITMVLMLVTMAAREQLNPRGEQCAV